MLGRYGHCFAGILWREGLRFIHQRGRFAAALVRPLVWLFIFATGLHAMGTVSAHAPYATAISYEVYITPGLIAMVQLFNGMQSSLSMVYDREMGSMRVLLTSPMPRWFLLISKLLASVLVSVLQVYVFLLIARIQGVQPPLMGYATILPALVLSGCMLGALGLLLSSMIRQLENFAGVMNFVIFPMFFASSALYPLAKITVTSNILHTIASVNPFTYAVELIRFALYVQLDFTSFAAVTGFATVFLAGAIYAYDPSRGLIARVRGPGG
jgi:ABC-2 type transport system permease protein